MDNNKHNKQMVINKEWTKQGMNNNKQGNQQGMDNNKQG